MKSELETPLALAGIFFILIATILYMIGVFSWQF